MLVATGDCPSALVIEDVSNATAARAAYKRFAGSFLTGVGVATAISNGVDVGCTVNSMASVSVRPPRMLVCLCSDSGTLAAARASGSMALSLLTADREGENAALIFSRRGPQNVGQVRHARTPSGLLFVSGSVAAAELDVVEEHPVADHSIVICRPRWLSTRDSTPLGYWRSRYQSAPLCEVSSGPSSSTPDLRRAGSQDLTSRDLQRRTDAALVPAPSSHADREAPSVLVVADDLTGANATGAGFARAGLRTVTVDASWEASARSDLHGQFDVVVVNTDTRHAAATAAAAAVSRVVRAGWPVPLVSKRIDTTLRGNVGVEAEATIQAVAKASGRRVAGLCLPAHPSAGRVTVNGTQLLHGRRLEETELARDPRSPVRSSRIEEVLARGTSLRTSHLGLDVVAGDVRGLVDALRTAVTGEADLVIGDALTEEHLVSIADAAATLAAEDPDLIWVGVDSGPGSLALARAMALCDAPRGAPLLAVSGSATELTRAQLRCLVADRTVVVVRPVPTSPGRPVPHEDATVAALSSAVRRAQPGEIVLLATVLQDSDVVVLESGEGTALAAALGRITRRVLDDCEVDGVFTTGGDVTTALLQQMEAHGLEVEDEVVPLAVSGLIVGGRWSGLPVVTKGGLVGDVETTLMCLDRLLDKARQRRRSVQSAGSNALYQ